MPRIPHTFLETFRLLRNEIAVPGYAILYQQCHARKLNLENIGFFIGGSFSRQD